MAWYWIVLIVIGYMLIWILTTAIIYKYIEGTNTEILPSVALGMLWPTLILPAIVGAIIKSIIKK